MPLLFSYRSTFTDTTGTPFDTGGASRSELDAATVLHFTAPIGTTYTKVIDVSGKAGEDSFGAIGGADYLLVVNRGEEAITLRLDGAAAGGDAFVVLDVGRSFGIAQPGQVITTASKGTRMASLSAKTISRPGVIEVLACTMEAVS